MTRAIKGGWLANNEKRRGHAAKLQRAAPLPDAVSALPAPAVLREVFEGSNDFRTEDTPPPPHGGSQTRDEATEEAATTGSPDDVDSEPSEPFDSRSNAHSNSPPPHRASHAGEGGEGDISSGGIPFEHSNGTGAATCDRCGGTTDRAGVICAECELDAVGA